MGIYVKGMKIPKDCEDCRFCIGLADTEFGTCAGCLIDNEYREASSKSGCPLVEIPEHGKLIDADVLLKKTINNPLHAPYIVAKDIRDMPTIIEAEGSDDA